MANTIRGGDIRRLSIDGREYSPAQDSEFSYVPGQAGRQEHETVVLGDGTLASTARRRPVGVTSGTVLLKDGDLEALHNSNDGESHPVVMELATGTSYAGELVLNGELTADSTGQLEFSALGAAFERI